MTKILLFLWAYPKKWLPNLVDGADDDRWKVDLGERPSGRRYRCHLKRWVFVGLHIRHSWPDERLRKRTKGKRKEACDVTKLIKAEKRQKMKENREDVPRCCWWSRLLRCIRRWWPPRGRRAQSSTTKPDNFEIINHKTWQYSSKSWLTTNEIILGGKIGINSTGRVA